MARIERTIKIAAPPERVYEVLSDLDRLPDWSTITVDTEEVPEPPLRQGQRFEQRLRILGRTITTTWTVEEAAAPERLAYRAETADGGTLRMRQIVRSEGDGSVVELDLEYQLPGGLLGDLLDQAYAERRNEREAEHSLQNLKELVETSPRCFLLVLVSIGGSRSGNRQPRPPSRAAAGSTEVKITRRPCQRTRLARCSRTQGWRLSGWDSSAAAAGGWWRPGVWRVGGPLRHFNREEW